jgi:hypothetical protein
MARKARKFSAGAGVSFRDGKYVTGVEAASRALANVPEEIRAALVKAMVRGGETLKEAAEELAPVSVGGGDLKASIYTEFAIGQRNKRGKLATFARGADLADNSLQLLVKAGDDKQTAIAGLAQEFGRAPGGEGVNANHPGHDPQPFMFPAWFSQIKKIRRRIKSALTRAVKKAAKRG